MEYDGLSFVLFLSPNEMNAKLRSVYKMILIVFIVYILLLHITTETPTITTANSLCTVVICIKYKITWNMEQKRPIHQPKMILPLAYPFRINRTQHQFYSGITNSGKKTEMF